MRDIKKFGSNSINYIKFFLKEVIANMFLAYLIPVINILIIVLLNEKPGCNNAMMMNIINILLATNACYMASISSYFKLKEKYNQCAGYIKTIGIVISVVTFAISTYELQIDSFKISLMVYMASAIMTSLLCIVLTIFSKLEALEVDKRIMKTEVEKARDLIANSENTKEYDIDGEKFEV